MPCSFPCRPGAAAPCRPTVAFRRLLAALVAVAALAAPAFADAAPEDPRDRQIRELRQMVEGLLHQAPPAASPAATADAGSEEPVDPGPEPPPPAPVQAQASASGTGSQPAMNPNISVVALPGGQSGGRPDDPQKNSFFLEEVEVAIQAPVDPNARLDAYVTFPRDEAPEIEEAFATALNLPGGLQARAGLFRNEFGRINPLHTHALPQIDRPLPVEQFLGGEGLRSPGAEVSWLAPLPWYSKATVQVTSRYTEPVEGEFALFPSTGLRKPLWIGRWENMADLGEDTTLMLGLSGATSEIRDGTLRNARLAGADLTLKWSPLDDPNTNLVWQSEYLAGRQAFEDPTLEADDFNGWYSYLNYRFNRNWRAGVRYDEADLPGLPGLRQRRGTALLEFISSEWNTLRLQFSRYNPNFDQPYNEFRLQWNLVIGPHGAHKY